ncbi:GNAT family N-acetyltransferase [Aquibaculum arenosum]|uniref:GNAT family N-acetyltransferase n=1 Tax=Aquibaculum arenosum TaxID=3032591 RepID=A0ABT5YML6_9PROT|nr:GNAT family N-acetyltransferase [Fodinicurvata sp. CAU 1616]MDF2095514.1 GNAT family N-acetyltransferase [Fodinicurvata sp. CAU 1616]
MPSPEMEQTAASHTHRYRPPEDGERLRALLEGKALCPLAAVCQGDEVEARLAPCPSGEPLRFLSPDAEETIRALSEAIRFLPKVTWKTSHTEMLLNGLRDGRWHGMALEQQKTANLVSYLDYCLREELNEVEIGFCMTHPDHRGRGLVSRLLASLLLLHFHRDFRVSTHESNLPMSRALARFGFTVVEERPRDRINGETTLYLTRKAGTGFPLEA